jgi:predicted PurR-regulated permease PerM
LLDDNSTGSREIEERRRMKYPSQLKTTNRPLRIDVSGATIARVLATCAGVWLWLRLWHWVLLLIVAAFLAVGLEPIVSWLDAHRVRRGYGAPLTILVILLILVGFGYFAGASLKDQAHLLGDRLKATQNDLSERLPPQISALLPHMDDGGSIGSALIPLGRALATGLLSIGIAFILALYFLLDGRRTFEWFVAFAPPPHRERVRQTAIEARQAVRAYVRGNAVTSVLAAVFMYLGFLVLKVPAALLLALLVGILDFIPVVGFILSVVPAVLLALTVSAWTAVVVAALYVVYHSIENYYIAPMVYGQQLRLSSLAVIGAFAVGAELAGVVGALIALPFAAMYPTIERMWLRDSVGEATVRDHRRIEETDTH